MHDDSPPPNADGLRAAFLELYREFYRGMALRRAMTDYLTVLRLRRGDLAGLSAQRSRSPLVNLLAAN